MVRALQRSIFGRNAGASLRSTSMALTPRSPRSMASVKPVGPPPTMRTSVSMRLLCNGLEIGELGSLLHEVADGAFERLEAAVAGSAQRVLHLHRLEHEERRAAPQVRAPLGEDPRHRARHRRDDPACRSGFAPFR